MYLGRAPRTKETLPDFLKWRRVTRPPLVFRGLTGSQRTPGFWGVTYTISFVMFYFHVLLSCIIIIYCDHVLFSHIVIMYRHILYSCTVSCTIFIYHVRLYNLMLQNLSSHSSAMLLISYHIFSHVIFKSFGLCFMPVSTKEVDT